MSIANRVKSTVVHLYRLHAKRDPFLRSARRWFRDRGDEVLRFDYPLDSNSLVIDVGGYHGDFAEAVNKRFGCYVIVFEPVPAFYSHCVHRFEGNPRIKIVDCGLGALDGSMPIEVAEDASSFSRSIPSAQIEVVKLRKANSVLADLGITKIDLMKINIEGGEYDLLRTLIDSSWVTRIRYLQVQFHNFVPDAMTQRNEIRSALSVTHHEMWNYEFVWESWEIGK